MAFTATVVDPHTEPVPGQWDELAGQDAAHPLWESWIQQAMGWYEQCPTLMTVVTDPGGSPVALFHSRHLGLPGRPYRFVSADRRRVVGVVESQLSPGHATAGHHFRPELDQRDRAEAVAAYEQAVARRLRWRCTGFMYRQVGEADLPAFTRRGRITLKAEPDAILDNRWESVDDYLASRPTRHRTPMLRAHRAIRDDPTVVADIEKELPAVEFAQLAHVVRLRHQPGPKITNPRPPMYYDLLARHGTARYVTYRDMAGRLVAAGMMLDDGTTVRSHGWGLRPLADGGRRHLYFDHFLRQISHVIDHGRERMVMGKTMFALKERFGARPVPLYLVASVR